MVGYLAPVPEILEVERYRALAEKALHRPVVKVWMVDARYGRGGTTPSALSDVRPGGAPYPPPARRRGKLMLLDIGDGPTLGVRYGMTGGLVVDGQQALDRLRYGPGVFDEKWVRARMQFADGGALQVHDPRRFGSLELAPDEQRLGPDALTASLADVRQALAVAPRAGPVAPASRLASWTRNVWPASATCWPTRSCGGPASEPGPAYSLDEAEDARAAQGAAFHPAPVGSEGRVAHGRPHGGTRAGRALPA